MGKRQIADMQPSELVVTLLISEIAAIPIQDTTQPVLSAVVAIFTLTSFEMIMAFITLKSNFINNIANGKSAVIIKDGKILQHRLKKLRLTVADLVEMLRVQGIFDIGEVEYAVFETNGNLSVLQKPYYANVKLGDIKNCKNEGGAYTALVVSDGKLLKRGIEDVDSDINEVMRILKIRGIELKDVFIMTLDTNGKVTVIEKEDEK